MSKKKQGMSNKDWTLLLTRIKEGNCTPFLGAGASSPYFPLANQLALHWSRKFNYPFSDGKNLMRVSRFMSLKYDPMFPKEQICREFQGRSIHYNKNQIHCILAELPFSLYLTTNYDDFMFTALKMCNRNVILDYCRWNDLLKKEGDKIDKSFVPTIVRPLVYHLHGIYDNTNSMVLTEDDYIEFLENVNISTLHPCIERSLTGDSSLLFLGYSLEDFTFRSLRKIESSLKRKSFSVQIDPQEAAAHSINAISDRLIDSISELLSESENYNEGRDVCNRIIDSLKQHNSLSEIDVNFYLLHLNKLENRIIEMVAKSKKSQRSYLITYFLDIINSFRDSIRSVNRVIQARDFLEEYLTKKINTAIYWGTLKEFAEELLDRWKNYSNRI